MLTINLEGFSHLSTSEGIPQPRQESLLSLLWDSAAAVGYNSETHQTYFIPVRWFLNTCRGWMWFSWHDSLDQMYGLIVDFSVQQDFDLFDLFSFSPQLVSEPGAREVKKKKKKDIMVKFW